MKQGLASCHCCLQQPRSSATVSCWRTNLAAQAEEPCCSQTKLALASMSKGFCHVLKVMMEFAISHCFTHVTILHAWLLWFNAMTFLSFTRPNLHITFSQPTILFISKSFECGSKQPTIQSCMTPTSVCGLHVASLVDMQSTPMHSSCRYPAAATCIPTNNHEMEWWCHDA